MPEATSVSTSRTMSSAGFETSRPRVKGTMQKVQTLSQPFMMVMNSLTFPTDCGMVSMNS